MIKLYGKSKKFGDLEKLAERSILRISTSAEHPPRNPSKDVYLTNSSDLSSPHVRKYVAILCSNISDIEPSFSRLSVQLPDELSYLEDGDIICLEKSSGFIRVLYRRRSPHNSLLLTERCNHYCLMCSQPPRDHDDGFLVTEILDAVPLMSRATRELGLSGGEPTLTGDGFFRIVECCKLNLPETSLHILTNGRTFNAIEKASRIAKIKHPDLMLGIPLYSDYSVRHNFIVQSDNAFDETIRGIINLKSSGVRVEVRFVLHKFSVVRLREFSEFVRRNLLFVDHIAFMGLETIGFAKSNINELWIDPADYMDDLKFACENLASDGANVSIYNSQLCLLRRELLQFYRHSISDWKNEFLPECENCYGKSHCCGFFASNQKYHSSYIKPFSKNNELESYFTI